MRTLTALAMALAAASCAQPERPAGGGSVDPRQALPLASLEAQVLPTMVLETNEDFDRWEDAVLARADARMVFVLYRPVCEALRSPRAFVRWLLFTWSADLPDEARQYVQKYSKIMEDNRADSPDVRYLVGYAAWRQLVGGRDQPQAPAGSPPPALIDTVAKAWGDIATRWPDWKGPHGMTGAELARRVRGLEASLSPRAAPPPPARIKAPKPELWTAFEEYYRRAEDVGALKACDRVDDALAVKSDPLPLGDAYAHCALDRDNPTAALDQLEKMVAARVTGGIPAVVVRLRIAAAQDGALAARLAVFEDALRSAAIADPTYAERCGFSGWLPPKGT